MHIELVELQILSNTVIDRKTTAERKLDHTNEHILVTLASQRFFNNGYETVNLVDNPEINAFVNDLEHYPHAFLLGCLMTCQI